MAGETGPITNNTTLAEAMVISAFFAVSLWNSMQTFFFIYKTFKRFHGLYFWSMCVANFGIPLRQVTALLRFFGLAPNLHMIPFIAVGFFMMVTGQSVVLYSRLQLVVGDPRKLRWVACLIAATFLLLEVPTSSLLMASNVPGSPAALARVFTVVENVQTGVISAQEATISAMYVVEARRALKPMQLIKGEQVRRTVRQLVGLLVLTAVLDGSLMALQYTGMQFPVMTTYKGVVYSIKLQVEAVVLNDLTRLVRQDACGCHTTPAENFSSQRTRRGSGLWTGGRLSGSPARMKQVSEGTATATAEEAEAAETEATMVQERHSAELRRIFGG